MFDRTRVRLSGAPRICLIETPRIRLHEAVRTVAEIGQDADTPTPEDTMSATVTTLDTPLMRHPAGRRRPASRVAEHPVADRATRPTAPTRSGAPTRSAVPSRSRTTVDAVGSDGTAADVTRPTRPRTSTTRLTRRGRIVLVVAALVALCGLTVGLGSQVIATDEPGRPVPSRMVTVAPGDTLWDLARDANPGGDVRSTVHEIAELNALSSSGEISAGQRIAVPLY